MSEEEKKAIEYYQNKEMSFTCDIDTQELLKALGIEETEEDSFENHTIRFKTLLNLIEKQNEKIEQLKKQNEDLYEDNIVYHNIMIKQNRREYRSKFLKEFQEEYGINSYPDYDEIYKRYYNLKNNSIPKSVIREYKDKFIEDSKNETVFMTQSTQINASLISFCNELLGGSNE